MRRWLGLEMQWIEVPVTERALLRPMHPLGTPEYVDEIKALIEARRLMRGY